MINSLLVECPELCKDWHPTKNLPLTPATCAYGSQRKIWWKCKDCNHEWECHLNNRRKQYKGYKTSGTGCPKCLRGNNSVGDFNPEIVSEWHPTKNGKLTAYDMAKSSQKKYWWKCPVCENDWEAACASRSANADCPQCSKQFEK